MEKQTRKAYLKRGLLIYYNPMGGGFQLWTAQIPDGIPNKETLSIYKRSKMSTGCVFKKSQDGDYNGMIKALPVSYVHCDA